MHSTLQHFFHFILIFILFFPACITCHFRHCLHIFRSTFQQFIIHYLLSTIVHYFVLSHTHIHTHTCTHTHIHTHTINLRMLWSNCPPPISHHLLPPTSGQIHFMLLTEVCSIQVFISQS